MSGEGAVPCSFRDRTVPDRALAGSAAGRAEPSRGAISVDRTEERTGAEIGVAAAPSSARPGETRASDADAGAAAGPTGRGVTERSTAETRTSFGMEVAGAGSAGW